MTNLDRLIAELCPDGVGYKTLGELCSIGVGQAPIDNEEGIYPFINAGTTPSGYLSLYNTEPDTITTPSRGQGGIGYVGYQAERFWCGPLCYRINSVDKKVLTKFIYYIMSNNVLKIIGLANMTGVPALNRKELVGFPVPVPPLLVQQEIVRILDSFIELTAELVAEIEARQKQYEYYREKLLTFSEV